MALNRELSDLFHALAALMELRGDNVFKVIAFQKVSRILREVNVDLKKCIEEGKLCEIEGIGKGSQQIIEEFVETGKSSVFEEVASAVPKGLVPLMSIEGLGPKTINLLWKERGITSLDALINAIDDGSLATLKGIGPKKIDTIKKGIAQYKANLEGGGDGGVRRVGILPAMREAIPLLERVRTIPGIVGAEIAGSLRRKRETIADVDIVAAVKDPSQGTKISEMFVQLPGVIQTMVAGPSKTSVKIANGMQVDLRLVPAENFGAALLYFTGSKEHNVKIRGLAQKKGMTLNEWGLYKLDEYEKAAKEIAKAPPIKPVASKTEEDVYEALGLVYIEPELREGFTEIDLAREKKLPVLIEQKDIRSDLHTHTTESDGLGSIEEMAHAAKEMGYDVLAITDHSKAMGMTNGLSVERLLKHIDNVHRISEKLKGITLLVGSEVDILVDGRLDYEDDVLKQLDIVVASPHLSLKQDAKKATDRMLRAIENPYVNIIGHPTGRLINGREGLPLEMDKIIERAAKTGTALEINAGYPRLDLNDTNARNAIEAGCVLSINTDAHSVPEFQNMSWGIGVARRAGATKKHVINTWFLKDLRAFIAKKRP
ncbi:MAG TPA: DNA polymerase/3'-5' exonuclease PolX [Tepidisphaeraceae bacterium]|nr:DNA polymerase/3'-5' exonuclease PolX [Tepidisphaeraceae bacterium]